MSTINTTHMVNKKIKERKQHNKTIFVIIIDCVIGATVEQVYSSTFKFCL